MPKIAIIDHIVSAGGVERFLHGLIAGMMQIPEIREWDITAVLNRHNSGTYEIRWPHYLTAPNLHVRYLRDDWPSRLLDRMAVAERLVGIRGSAKAQRFVPWLLRRYGTWQLRSYAGDKRLWLQHFCRQQKFDVVYFSYPYLMECPELTMPLVVTPHDFNFKRFNTFNAETRSQIDRQMPAWLNKSKFLVVSSEFIASELRHFYPDFADKVRIVRLGIPSSTRLPHDDEIESYRQRMSLPARFLLTAGWIVSHKNQLILFRALGELRKRGINIPLVCVGPNSDQLQPQNIKGAGHYMIEVLKAAADLGLEYGRDYWGLGYVDDFELECLYRSAFALIVPTLYEAGSFPAREAMRARCPVACSRIPALMEEAHLVEDTLWLFEPTDFYDLANVIEYMLSNTSGVSQRAQRAQNIVDRVFSWEKTAEGYFRVFQEAMSSTRNRGREH